MITDMGIVYDVSINNAGGKELLLAFQCFMDSGF